MAEHKSGKVLEVLSDMRYRILLDTDEEIIAYLSGKMRHRRVSVRIGDTVKVLMDPYGGRASNRVVWRE